MQYGKVSITRLLRFCSGHRVLGHEGKCSALHGHDYSVEISVVGNETGLDSLGRVIDFGVIKSKIGGWIDLHLDHKMILNPEDPFLLHCYLEQQKTGIAHTFTMPVEYPNPTAENIARLIWDVGRAIMPHEVYGVKLENVRVWETPNCYADYHQLETKETNDSTPSV